MLYYQAFYCFVLTSTKDIRVWCTQGQATVDWVCCPQSWISTNRKILSPHNFGASSSAGLNHEGCNCGKNLSEWIVFLSQAVVSDGAHRLLYIFWLSLVMPICTRFGGELELGWIRCFFSRRDRNNFEEPPQGCPVFSWKLWEEWSGQHWSHFAGVDETGCRSFYVLDGGSAKRIFGVPLHATSMFWDVGHTITAII